MKRVFILVVAVFLCAVSFAQEKGNAQKELYKVYCEIVGQTHMLSNKVDVELDFGQAYSFWSGDRRLYDENGKKIVFNSMLDAANYMARRGWELEEAFPVSSISNGNSGSPEYHWIMSKMVENDSQITDGLKTGDMLKK